MTTSMKTCEELLKQWDMCNGSGQVLVDYRHPLRMYLNINPEGHRELIIPVERPEHRFEATYAIGVRNYENKKTNYYAIELLLPDLEKEYLSLCFDLIESSREFDSAATSRQALFQTFKKWYALLSKKPLGILPLNEIRGLLGEIQYIIDEIKASRSDVLLANAWKIHKDSSRDFVFDDTWDEVKTIETSKNYVTISSLDQLNNDTEGRLVIYRLNSSNGIHSFDLNGKVDELKSVVGFQAESELSRKLLAKGYSYNAEYEKHRFVFDGRMDFRVDDQFPKIRRADVDPAILNAKYDLDIGRIRRWLVDGSGT